MICCLGPWKWIAAVAIFVAVGAAAATAPLGTLTEFACTYCFDRTPEAMEAWMKYKNEKNPSPKLVDLGGNAVRDVCRILLTTRADWGGIGEPTEYESRVLRLRKGDRVKFGDRIFRLGEFLGTGNATHIFRLQGEKGVLRIPFLVHSVVAKMEKMMAPAKVGEDPQERRLKTIRFLSQQFPENLRRKKGAVSILESDPEGRFVVVDEIDATESGFEFLQSIAVGRLKPGQMIFAPGFQLLDRNQLSEEQLKKFDALIELMVSNRVAIPLEDRVSGGSSEIISITIQSGPARQYLWDRTLARWIVADAE